MRALMIIAIVVAVGVSACGRRGAPELPEGEKDEKSSTFILDGLIKPKSGQY